MGIKPIIATLTNTTAGTRTQATASSTYATAVYFEALGTNVGYVYVGDSTVSATKYMARLAAGQGINVNIDSLSKADLGDGGELQLSTFYIDTSVSGEKCQFTYIQRVGKN